MPADNILVLVVDGLRASALGAYGNTIFPTPALDALAAQSFLLDNCFADSTDLRLIYRSLWWSLHPLRADEAARDRTTLPRQLSPAGYETTLVTDDAEVASLGAAAGFDSCVEIDSESAGRAEDILETSLARNISAASEAIRPISAISKPRLVWVHSRGLFGPWDAPLALQESLLDPEEGDPSPFDQLQSPDVAVSELNDPDAAYAIGCAYSAHVIVLDACIAAIIESLSEIEGKERWMTVLTGARGFALGEHGQIGRASGQLHGEILHVPMLWQFPNRSGELARSSRLVSHLDVAPTILEHVNAIKSLAPHDGTSLALLTNDQNAPWRQTLLAANASSERVIRTADWTLRLSSGEKTGSQEPEPAELFVQPDDRWEANNVAGLCPDEVVQLSAQLRDMGARIQRGDSMPAILDEESPAITAANPSGGLC
jgi:arylsulfatase A-like enzyme